MEPETTSNGALIGIVVIVIILILGGIYILQSNKKAATSQSLNTQPENKITNQDAATLNALEKDSAETNTSTGVSIDTLN